MRLGIGGQELARYNPHRPAEPIFGAAATWKERCLERHASVFTEDRALWTVPLLDEIDQRFLQNLDEGEGKFFEKLKVQLSEGSPGCRQLMAELLWILMLFQSNVTAEKKRENVQLVWSWSGEALEPTPRSPRCCTGSTRSPTWPSRLRISPV